MRHQTAQSIHSIVKRGFKEANMPYQKAGYRRAKKIWHTIPWNKRHLIYNVDKLIEHEN